MKTLPLSALLLMWIATPLVQADLVIPSDGSDGIFNPTANVEIDLSQAVTGAWNANNSANAGKGVYDSAKWAVVFKFSSIEIPTGVTVTFKNHPTHAPIVWLVQGSATISGTVDLSGKQTTVDGIGRALPAEPGPGGFRGSVGGAGFGIGGGAGQGHFDGVYGTPRLVPMIGGSGASTGLGVHGGGGGGGLLLAVGQQLNLSGSILANGGYPSNYSISFGLFGSGGAVRLIAENITGTGTINATSAWVNQPPDPGNNGRIRIESSSMTSGLTIFPAASVAQPGSPPVIWPPEDAPNVRIVSINGVNVSTDPLASLGASPDVVLGGVEPITVRAETRNFPTNGSVTLRHMQVQGEVAWSDLFFVSGNSTQAVWERQIPGSQAGINQYSVLQAKATVPWSVPQN